MLSYSRQQIERQLVADQALWRRVPVAAIAILGPLEILLLGWGIGWWTGLITAAALGAASMVAPPRLKVSIYLIDLLDQFVRLPLDLCWLLVVWHLWLREPIFPILDQPLLGAVALSTFLWILTRPLVLLARLAARRALS